MGWLDAAGSIVGGLLGFGASENNKDAAAAGTTTRAEIDPRLAPYYYGNQSTERRLRSGVNPIYTGGGAPTTGPNGEPLTTNMWGRTGYTDPETGAWVDSSSPNFIGGGSEKTLANPESDYETVNTGSPGIFDLAQEQFTQGGYTPEQQQLGDAYRDQFLLPAGEGYAKITGTLGAPMAMGATDFTLPTANPNVNLQDSREAQGPLDPTQAMTGLLSGQVDTAQLGALHQQAINRGAQGYSDLIDKVNTEVLPGMRSQAINAGQYGGSRQGIAEGLLGQQLAKNARDITQSAADVGSVENQNAFDAAQQRQYGTATGLSSQGYTAAQGNIGNEIAIFNQRMNNNTQNINNRVQGVNVMGSGFGLLDNVYNAAQGTYSAPSAANWGNLGNYSNIVLKGAGMGDSTNITQPQGTNWNSIAGGALTGMQLANSFGAPAPGGSNGSFYNGSGAPGMTANQYWF